MIKRAGSYKPGGKLMVQHSKEQHHAGFSETKKFGAKCLETRATKYALSQVRIAASRTALASIIDYSNYNVFY